jgi:hypothetical protein
MKLLRYIFICSLSFSYLIAGVEHCVEVKTLQSFDKNNMDPFVSKIFDSYKNVRVEKYIDRFVLRVGRFDKPEDGSKILQKIQLSYEYAFIRECKYDESSIVYDNFKSTKKELPKALEIKKEVKRYTYSDEFYKECKKCFYPLSIENEIIEK